MTTDELYRKAAKACAAFGCQSFEAAIRSVIAPEIEKRDAEKKALSERAANAIFERDEARTRKRIAEHQLQVKSEAYDELTEAYDSQLVEMRCLKERLKEPHPDRDFANEFNDLLKAKDAENERLSATISMAERDMNVMQNEKRSLLNAHWAESDRLKTRIAELGRENERLKCTECEGRGYLLDGSAAQRRVVECPKCGGAERDGRPPMPIENCPHGHSLETKCADCLLAEIAKELGADDSAIVFSDYAAQFIRDKVAELRQWIHDLQSGMYVNCVYCGHRYGPGETTPVSMADALKEHVQQCPKHPMSELRRDADRYRWLRKQTWDASNLAVVAFPQHAIKLGHDCPSHQRLDAAIDAALESLSYDHRQGAGREDTAIQETSE